MRSRHSPEEKYEIVMESLTENMTKAEICRRHGIFPTQLAKWKEQFIEGGKKGLSSGKHPYSREEEIDDLKKMIGEQTLVINAFKKRLQEGSR
jgi:transposase-like protein